MNNGGIDEEMAIRLRRVIGKLARQLNASSTGAGLTPSQASVLGLIVARGPLSLVELGQARGAQSHDVVPGDRPAGSHGPDRPDPGP